MRAEPLWLRIVTGVVVIAAVVVLVWPATGWGETVAIATSANGTTVTLTDEPCALPVVVNLPHRATWAEKGATLEGCYAIAAPQSIPGLRLVVGYFSDRTVVLIPAGAFRGASAI